MHPNHTTLQPTHSFHSKCHILVMYCHALLNTQGVVTFISTTCNQMNIPTYRPTMVLTLPPGFVLPLLGD